jgi:hypothetical protein
MLEILTFDSGEGYYDSIIRLDAVRNAASSKDREAMLQRWKRLGLSVVGYVNLNKRDIEDVPDCKCSQILVRVIGGIENIGAGCWGYEGDSICVRIDGIDCPSKWIFLETKAPDI